MEITTLAKPRNRFYRDPRGKAFAVQATDLLILQLLNRYRYLPSTYIRAFLAHWGFPSKYYTDRFTLLRHEGGLIDCPDASWGAANARQRPAVYMLTKTGERELKRCGLYRPLTKTGEGFKHEFMRCLVEASFELGAIESGVRLITAPEILAHPSCPQSTRRSKTPFEIPDVSYTFVSPSGHRKSRTRKIAHDGEPLGFAFGDRTVFTPGREIDRDTEPGDSEDPFRTSWRDKFLSIRQADRDDLYRKRLGIPNNFIPFVTIGPYPMRHMMDILDDATNGRGSKIMLFTHIPDFTSFETFPPATGWALTSDWQRVGHEPFNFLRALAVPV